MSTSRRGMPRPCRQEEKPLSNYRRQQRHPTARAGQGQAKTTPTRHWATPTIHTQPKIHNQRAISTRGQSQRSHTSKATPSNRGICTFCGTTGHGEQEKTAHRRLHCPAFGTTCSTCGRLNPSAHMCWQNIEHESAMSEQVDTMSEGTLHHQTWDQTPKSWSPRRSPPQPNLNVSISVRAEDFRRHGHTLREKTHNLVWVRKEGFFTIKEKPSYLGERIECN